METMRLDNRRRLTLLATQAGAAVDRARGEREESDDDEGEH
jgi:hypothetical protein